MFVAVCKKTYASREDFLVQNRVRILHAWKAAKSSRNSAYGARGDLALKRFHYFGKRFGTEVAFGAVADGDSSGLGFFCADHQHIRNLLQLRVANLGGQFFVAIVEMDTQ